MRARGLAGWIRESFARWLRVQPAPPPASPQLLEISLEELAALWLPHNEPDLAARGVTTGAAATPAKHPTPRTAQAGIDAQRGQVPLARAPMASAGASPHPVASLVDGREETPVDAPNDRTPIPRIPALATVASAARVAPPNRESAPASPVPDRVGAAAPAGVRLLEPPTWETLLAPLWPGLRAKQVEGTVEALIACLDQHGSCPSLVLSSRGSDPETKDLYTVRDSLGRISLRDHTARVVWHALELTRRTYSPGIAESRLPQALIMALGHDLGKIPAFRGHGAYAKSDHPAISVVKVQELWQGPAPHWREAALTAIRDHHRASKDPLTQLLQRADARAREEELALTAGALTVQSWPAWFDPAMWIELVAKDVDMLQRGNEWLAISHQGTVYCRIDLLVQAARHVLRAKQAIDLTFIVESQRDQAAILLVDWLRRQGWLAQPIGSGYYGLPYEVHFKRPGGQSTTLSRVYLVPLRQEIFGATAREFTSRKIGILALLESVRAVPIRASA